MNMGLLKPGSSFYCINKYKHRWNCITMKYDCEYSCTQLVTLNTACEVNAVLWTNDYTKEILNSHCVNQYLKKWGNRSYNQVLNIWSFHAENFQQSIV